MQSEFKLKDAKTFAASLFNYLENCSTDNNGITRESYGEGENRAHQLIYKTGEDLGLEVSEDPFGNTYCTLPGTDRAARKILIGSHLDSVRQGGNFDGSAGVVSGLTTLFCLLNAGIKPKIDVSIVALRAEEGCWFPETWLGSRLALGLLSQSKLASLCHVDTGLSLAAHMIKCGYPTNQYEYGKSYLNPTDIACFIEPHIEQGPRLDMAGKPIGIVTSIMGGPRYRDAKIFGSYMHTGGAPLAFRNDSVAAFGDFVSRLNGTWRDIDKAGEDAVITFGIVNTDSRLHSFSRVPGEVSFCLDVRCENTSSKLALNNAIAEISYDVATTHGVRFDFGEDSGPEILGMDVDIRNDLTNAANKMGVPYQFMPSGAGHDAGAFIEAGVPTAMIFIRNQNGSHNPNEAMDLADLMKAVDILFEFIQNYCHLDGRDESN